MKYEKPGAQTSFHINQYLKMDNCLFRSSQVPNKRAGQLKANNVAAPSEQQDHVSFPPDSHSVETRCAQALSGHYEQLLTWIC